MSEQSPEDFFYAHAGGIYNPATQTPEQGRRECAKTLAEAERRLREGPYFIEVEPDPTPWDGCVPYDGPLWSVSLYEVSGSTYATEIGSLHSVACKTVDDPYIRVVSAELANEYIPAG